MCRGDMCRRMQRIHDWAKTNAFNVVGSWHSPIQHPCRQGGEAQRSRSAVAAWRCVLQAVVPWLNGHPEAVAAAAAAAVAAAAATTAK